MQFKFDANQEYQIRAIESVVDLFEGQPLNKVELKFALGSGFAAVANRLDLGEEALLENLRTVQERNKLKADNALQWIEEEIETVAGKTKARFANFSVEMETGTGKTYVYLRTALELSRRFGMRKFIIVVPSVAVREGVKKTFEITEKHLKGLYDNAPYRFYVYDSSNLSQVRQFAISPNVEFMIMTIDSFNKASNVIRNSTDLLQGETPIHLVQATRPVLILDEPQNFKSDLRVSALAMLDPLVALRYSATHHNVYNLVYRLTPVDAYRQGLVKKIEVAGVEKMDDANQVFLRVDEIRAEKRTLTTRLAVQTLLKDGKVKEQIVTVKQGDNLREKTNRDEYGAFEVAEINAGEDFVEFTNGVKLTLGESQGADKETIFAAQIRYTIEEHFKKQRERKAAGIKVLSLFFIDRVDNYALEDGLIRQQFTEAFKELQKKYSEWAEVDADDVHDGYFAKRKTKEGVVIFEDSKTGESEKDREAYDLIMKNKEQLLSFEGKVSFIFSHSALREGWDNPNIFQVCTLREVGSERERRQQIGRGIRLSVNQKGDRVRDDRVNVLTVIANESYSRFCEEYQSEILREFGKDGVPPKPANARAKAVAKLRKQYKLSDEFKELWRRISHKTRYAVKIDSKKLLEEVVAELGKQPIRAPSLKFSKGRIEAEEQKDLFTTRLITEKGMGYKSKKLPLPNLVELMLSLMERTTPPVRLTRKTLLEIFKKAKNNEAALKNPHEFATVAVRIIKEKLSDQLVDGIEYEKLNEWYEMRQFEMEISSWAEYLIPVERCLYDHVIVDSAATDPKESLEGKFAKGLEGDDRVKLYVKLPSWFVVNTPVGSYNPDWAIVMEQRDEHGERIGKDLLYLVRETKDLDSELRPDEKRKVECGKRHFHDALNVDYRAVKDVGELVESV